MIGAFAGGNGKGRATKVTPPLDLHRHIFEPLRESPPAMHLSLSKTLQKYTKKLRKNP